MVPRVSVSAVTVPAGLIRFFADINRITAVSHQTAVHRRLDELYGEHKPLPSLADLRPAAQPQIHVTIIVNIPKE